MRDGTQIEVNVVKKRKKSESHLKKNPETSEACLEGRSSFVGLSTPLACGAFSLAPLPHSARSSPGERRRGGAEIDAETCPRDGTEWGRGGARHEAHCPPRVGPIDTYLEARS